MPMSFQDLKAAAGALRRAKSLVEGVRDLFRGNDGIVAARMNDIATRIEDEHEFVDRLAAKSSGQNP